MKTRSTTLIAGALAVLAASAVPTVSHAAEWSGKGFVACKVWSGVVRRIAVSSEKGYGPEAAMLAIEGSKRVDARLHQALATTVKGIYSKNHRSMVRLAVSDGWAGACSDLFLPKDLQW